MREMKDSGIEWIGKIPFNWTVGRIKYNYYLKGRIGWQGLKADEFIDEGPYLVTGTDFCDGRVNWDTCYHISEERYEEAPEIHVRINDLLITKDGTVGKVVYIDSMPEKVSLNSHLLIMRPINREYNNKYLFWVIKSPVFERYFLNSQYGTIMASLSQEKINDFSYAMPSESQQECIANYLDFKCSKIDEIIAKQEKIIEKLKEYKLSVITEAVTKGLDPNVEMKDSGVEWAGKIPQSWRVTKISHICRTLSGSTPDRGKYDEYYEGGSINWIKTLDLNDWFVSESSEKITETALANSSCSILPTGTVCVAMYGGAGTIGKCGILKMESATNQAICAMVPNNELLPEFLLFQLLTLKKDWMRYAVGTRKDPNISQNTVGRMRITIPSLAEQEEIIRYLYNICVAIDTTIEKKEKIIKKLLDFKKSVIYEVVTGKKEV